MQKQSQNWEIVFSPMPLDAGLAIQGGEPFVQGDSPITFLHVHDCLELGYCYSGSGIFVVGEKVLPYSAGDVSFINHTEVHLARSAPGTRSEWTWIYLDPIRLVAHPEVELAGLDPTTYAGHSFENILTATGHPAINRIVLRMIEELNTGAPGHGGALRALAWELMTLMRRASSGAGEKSPPSRPEYDRLAPALQILAREYHQPLRVPELAGRCGMSESHFRRLFQRTIGRVLRSYWNDLRLRMAASLLRGTSRSVLEISHDVGFETLSSFNRLFRTHFGTAPRDWRGGNES